MSTLKEKLSNKTAVLGVCGLGYVGLPLAVEKAKAGFTVIGFDIQESKVNMVNAGHNYIGDVVNEDLAAIVASGKLRATSDFSFVKDVDCICIAVPTPLDKHQQPDISYVKSSTESIAPYLHKDMLVVLESTTYPGTTEELIKPILEKASGLKCGKDFYLAFSPERVDPGNLVYKTKNTPKVVGGITPECTDIAATMYEAVLEAPVYRVSSPAVAEMEKILENTYRNINIGLVNELAQLCHRMGISIWEVIDAAKTKPYGFHTSMIEASMMINDKMPEYTVDRLADILNKQKKSLNGAKILQLGVAYKNDIDDYRESPALVVREIMNKNGCIVDYYDPWVSEYSFEGNKYSSLKEISPEIIKKYDAVIITAGHTQRVDYQMVVDNAIVIFDTKNVLKSIAVKNNIETL